MKVLRSTLIIIASTLPRICMAGLPNEQATSNPLDPPRFEMALESAYLLSAINSLHSYEVSAEFITARMRWGVVGQDKWYSGFQQVYLTGEIQPIVRGIENLYFGMNIGLRYNFVRGNSRFIPYFSGGLGVGWIDSNTKIPGGQGQDFTFNILSAAGVSYRLNDRWKVSAGALWEHWSNGGQTDPNPSLNMFGPQAGISCSF